MKVHRLKINAKSNALITAVGNYVGVIGPTGATARIKTDKGLDVDLSQGQHVRNLERFEGVWAYNESDQDIVIDVSVGFGEIVDNQLQGSVSQAANLSAVGLDAVTFVSPGVADTIAANPDRKNLIINTASTNAGLIYIGSDTIGRGIPMAANSTFDLPVTGAISVIADTAGEKLYLVEVL